mmetsp:Transcript_7769/g.16697  ORF Transcript_7769/g.16697 Transcript_7769/m.16697 type:complete len:268 (-) Transcript_7769:165-968(-)
MQLRLRLREPPDHRWQASLRDGLRQRGGADLPARLQQLQGLPGDQGQVAGPGGERPAPPQRPGTHGAARGPPRVAAPPAGRHRRVRALHLRGALARRPQGRQGGQGPGEQEGRRRRRQGQLHGPESRPLGAHRRHTAAGQRVRPGQRRQGRLQGQGREGLQGPGQGRRQGRGQGLRPPRRPGWPRPRDAGRHGLADGPAAWGVRRHADDAPRHADHDAAGRLRDALRLRRRRLLHASCLRDASHGRRRAVLQRGRLRRLRRRWLRSI